MMWLRSMLFVCCALLCGMLHASEGSALLEPVVDEEESRRCFWAMFGGSPARENILPFSLLPEFEGGAEFLTQREFEDAWLRGYEQVRCVYLPQGRQRYSTSYDLQDLMFCERFTSAVKEVNGQSMLYFLHDKFLQGIVLEGGDSVHVSHERARLCDFNLTRCKGKPFVSDALEAFFVQTCTLLQNYEFARVYECDDWPALSVGVLQNMIPMQHCVEWSVVDRCELVQAVQKDSRETAMIFMLLREENFLLKGRFRWSLFSSNRMHERSLLYQKIKGLGVQRYGRVHFTDLPELRAHHPWDFKENWLGEEGQVRLVFFSRYKRYSATYDVSEKYVHVCYSFDGMSQKLKMPVSDMLGNIVLQGFTANQEQRPTEKWSAKMWFDDVDPAFCRSKVFQCNELWSFVEKFCGDMHRDNECFSGNGVSFNYGWTPLSEKIVRHMLPARSVCWWKMVPQAEFVNEVQREDERHVGQVCVVVGNVVIAAILREQGVGAESCPSLLDDKIKQASQEMFCVYQSSGARV